MGCERGSRSFGQLINFWYYYELTYFTCFMVEATLVVDGLSINVSSLPCMVAGLVYFEGRANEG